MYLWSRRSLRLKTLGILVLLLCAVGALSFAAPMLPNFLPL